MKRRNSSETRRDETGELRLGVSSNTLRWGSALAGALMLAACGVAPIPTPLSRDRCGIAACPSGTIRFQCGGTFNFPCVPLRSEGQTCNPSPTCLSNSPGVCGENLACTNVGGSNICVSTSLRLIGDCTAAPNSCPSGSYCLTLTDVNPRLPAGLKLCARLIPEAGRCVTSSGATGVLQCERGLVCQGGSCQRLCGTVGSSSDCACDGGVASGECELSQGGNPATCRQCWTPGGRDPQGRPLDSRTNAACCSNSIPNTVTGGCCRIGAGTACDSTFPCCDGYQCVSGTCQVCNGTNSICSDTNQCCSGLACSIRPGSSTDGRCCNPGFAYCTAGGSCVDTRSNPNQCGPNCAVCPAGGSGSSASVAQCTNGVCGVQCSNPSRRNCDANAANGCETDIWSNTNNCGGCGNVCPTPAAGTGTAICNVGVCAISCSPGLTQCGSQCVNTSNDPNNCGACGRQCSGSCSGGVCIGTSQTCAVFPANGPETCVNCQFVGQCCRAANGVSLGTCRTNPHDPQLPPMCGIVSQSGGCATP